MSIEFSVSALKKKKLRRLSLFFILNLLSIVFNFSIHQLTPDFPDFLLYFPAIVINTIIGGLFFGLLTTLIGGASVIYLFYLWQNFLIPQNLLVMLIFVIEGVIVAWAIENLRHSKVIEELEEKEKQLTRLYQEKDRELKIAKKEIRSRDEFLSIASHELKTPLTSMLLEIQVILHNIRNVSLAKFSVENLMKMLENAEVQTKRLAKMISDLLNVSLITSGKLSLEIEKVSLNQTVKDVIEKLSVMKDDSKIQYQEKEEITGMWDKIRLEQVVTNILSNALKYGNGHAVTVNLKKDRSKASFSVSDQGIGIANDSKEIIFERFKRGVSNKEYKGLGVGLYIVAQIVKAHKGKINVESRLGKGSTFTVTLPTNNK